MGQRILFVDVLTNLVVMQLVGLSNMCIGGNIYHQTEIKVNFVGGIDKNTQIPECNNQCRVELLYCHDNHVAKA